MIDLLTAKTGRARKHHVTGSLLIDAAGVGFPALGSHVLCLDAFGEGLRQLFRVAAESYLQFVDGENRLQMCHQFDAYCDALPSHLPSRTIFRAWWGIEAPKWQQAASDGRTARRRGLSELLPARCPRRPEFTINSRWRLRRQPYGPRCCKRAPRGTGSFPLLTAEPIEPFGHSSYSPSDHRHALSESREYSRMLAGGQPRRGAEGNPNLSAAVRQSTVLPAHFSTRHDGGGDSLGSKPRSGVGADS